MTQSNIKYVKWSCLDIVSLCSLLQCVVTYSSTYVLVALSIDRYDAITHPMNFSGSCKFISQFYYSEKYRDNAHIKHSAHLCFNFLRKTTKLSSVNIIWRSARIVNYFRNLSQFSRRYTDNYLFVSLTLIRLFLTHLQCC